MSTPKDTQALLTTSTDPPKPNNKTTTAVTTIITIPMTIINNSVLRLLFGFGGSVDVVNTVSDFL